MGTSRPRRRAPSAGAPTLLAGGASPDLRRRRLCGAPRTDVPACGRGRDGANAPRGARSDPSGRRRRGAARCDARRRDRRMPADRRRRGRRGPHVQPAHVDERGRHYREPPSRDGGGGSLHRGAVRSSAWGQAPERMLSRPIRRGRQHDPPPGAPVWAHASIWTPLPHRVAWNDLIRCELRCCEWAGW